LFFTLFIWNHHIINIWHNDINSSVSIALVFIFIVSFLFSTAISTFAVTSVTVFESIVIGVATLQVTPS